jgi:KDO2-lipid IV(A) lauroyltransferase
MKLMLTDILSLLILRLLSLLPLWVCRSVGKALGSLASRMPLRMCDTTRKNIDICYPNLSPAEKVVLSRKSLQHTFMTVMEAGFVWLRPANEVLATINSIENLEIFQQAHAIGKGVLVLAPHLGNWEVVGLYLNSCGLGQSYQLYQAISSPRLDQEIYQARSRQGATMVATDNRGVAELLKGLRAGGIVGILPDQVPNGNGGKFAPFFGKQTYTMTLLNRLQKKTEAPIIQCFAFRDVKSGGFRLIFQEVDPKTYAKHITESIEGLNRSIEQLIALAPEQYQWEYKRFKKQPEGQSEPY